MISIVSNDKMTFIDIIKEAFRQKKWNYYSDEYIEKLNIEKPDDCREFIRKFFAVSGKAGELNNINVIKSLTDERCQHIVYVFLLGVSVYNKSVGVKSLIDEQIQQYVECYKCKSDVNFYFIWFLCCLFHDLGYQVENSDKPVGKLAFAKGQNLIGVPKVFDKKTIENYWDYRQKCHKMNDHGIYAGITMYKSLCDIRSEQEKNSWKNDKICWEKELEHIYNIASWVVLCHNIWFVQKNEKCNCELYEKFNLNSLVLEKDKHKIKIDRHPLLFFFCLIDTIEPIKTVKDSSLLEQIHISFGEKEIVISSNLKCGCGDKYLKDVGDLNDWLTKTKREDNQVKIALDLK